MSAHDGLASPHTPPPSRSSWSWGLVEPPESTSSAPPARRRTSSHAPAFVAKRLEAAPAGWLVESGRALTNQQIAHARDIASNAGLTIEVQGQGRSQATAKGIATAAGAVLALAILALTVGLIRSENAGDLRTLTATGADSSVRRTLTATTAGALALLGALLGVTGAYVVLLAMYHDDLGHLSGVPLSYLAVAVVGVPLTAGATGWLLGGREPPTIARSVIE